MMQVKEMINWLELEMQEVERMKDELDAKVNELDTRWWVYQRIKTKLEEGVKKSKELSESFTGS